MVHILLHYIYRGVCFPIGMSMCVIFWAGYNIKQDLASPIMFTKYPTNERVAHLGVIWTISQNEQKSVFGLSLYLDSNRLFFSGNGPIAVFPLIPVYILFHHTPSPPLYTPFYCKSFGFHFNQPFLRNMQSYA